MKTLATITVLAFPALLEAQSTYSVLPRGFEHFQGETFDASYLGRAGMSPAGRTTYVPMHVQTGYDLVDLGRSTLKVRALSFRRNNWNRNTMYKSTQTLAIYMSHSDRQARAYSTTFASNEGKGRMQVFGTGGKPAILNWPEARYLENGQEPAPFAFKIPLSAPYPIDSKGGMSLCIDYVIRKRVSTYMWNSISYNANLFLDAAASSAGSRHANGTSPYKCKFSHGTWNWFLTYSIENLNTRGGYWYLRYGNVLSGAVGVATLSGFGVKTKPNPFKLPLDLSAVGAPGCYWNVGLETGFWVALKADPWGYMSWPATWIPKGMSPGSFYDQCLVFDAKANKAGLVVTQSSEWRIVHGTSPKCVTVYKHQDTTPPSKTGSIRKYYAAIIRLDA